MAVSCALVLSCCLAFAVSALASADGGGVVGFDPNVITNSGGSVGVTSDFPVRDELFTPALNRAAAKRMVDRTISRRRALDFSKRTVNVSYSTNTNSVVSRLFVDYESQMVGAARATNGTGGGTGIVSAVWYWAVGVTAIPLLAGAVMLGRWTARRRASKNVKSIGGAVHDQQD
ncbi:MAG: hypothetical protein SOI66_04255 [Bifidobacterium sp.]